MNTATRNDRKLNARRWLAAAVLAGLGGLGMTAPAAQAGHRDESLSIRIGAHDHRHDHRFREHEARVWVEPVYRTVCDKVWVEPVHQTVTERVWREPIVRDVCERVWVPERCETRRIQTRDRHGHRVYLTQRVVIEPGHFEERHRQVIVKPGCWENVARQVCVREGHWTTVERQELVTPGHYVTRVERGHHAHRHEPRRGFDFDVLFSLGR